MAVQRNQRGSTLLELIMVIVITGVIGAIVATFIKVPIDSYLAGARRAALTDVADTVVRRMARDIHKALPNSIRTPNTQCLEFIPTKTGGRYRVGAGGNDDTLDFTALDASFDMLGLNSDLPADQQIQVGDLVAVNNLKISGADAYTLFSDNTSDVTANPTEQANETNIVITANQFPAASDSKSFYVIPKDENVVAYVCSIDGTLRRTARTSGAAECPTTGSILANNVDLCEFTYVGFNLQRNEPVKLSIALTDNDETVRLYHEVHVTNLP